MNLLFWSAIGILALNAILLLFLLLRNRSPLVCIFTVPELKPGKPVITPPELRKVAWESWLSAHSDANPIEQDRARWIIEKEARRLEKRNRQQNPFADTQKPRG